MIELNNFQIRIALKMTKKEEIKVMQKMSEDEFIVSSKKNKKSQKITDNSLKNLYKAMMKVKTE